MANDKLIISLLIDGYDKANQNLSTLQTQLNNLSKEVTVSIKADGLGEVSTNLAKIREELRKLNEDAKNGAFESLSSSVKGATDSVNKLNEALERLLKTVSSGSMGGLKDELQKIIELAESAITKSASAKLGASGKSKARIADEEKATAAGEVARIEKMMRDIARVEAGFTKFGANLDSPMLTSARQKLSDIRDVLRSVDDKGNVSVKDSAGNVIFSGKASQYLKSTAADLVATKTQTSETIAEYGRLEAVMQKLQATKEKLQVALNENPNSQYASQLQAQIAGIERQFEYLTNARQNGSLSTLRNRIQDASDPSVMKEYEQTLKNVAEENKARVKAEKEAANAAKEQAKAQKQAEQAANARANAIQKLKKAIADLINLENSLKGLGTAAGAAKAADAAALRAQFESMLRSVESGSFTAYKSGAFTGLFANKDLFEKSTTEVYKGAKDEAAQLNKEIEKIAAGMTKVSAAGRLQQYVLSDLKSVATQYLSVWGMWGFAKEMAQITGELQLQQRSLEVIIGSAQKAGELFTDIRDLSQQSPYTFQDLLKSTRQLAAFGIQTKDLYGTMKALSDIGAGLSVDVQRLILAYGHTRSYGYLSGIQNRQFETAGIDLVGALAKYYNAIADKNEKAGKEAKRVSRKDVFKMISKKDVSFEDVNAVIMDLDKPGGKFYNMQERQFDTLGGKLRNLRNNYNIMMAEMGESSMGVLLKVVNGLNSLMANWDKWGAKIARILIPLGAYKALMMAINATMGAQSRLLVANTVGLARQQVATNATLNGANWWRNQGYLLTTAYGRTLRDSTYLDQRKFAYALQRNIDNGSVTQADARMMALNGRLSQGMRYEAGLKSGLSADEAERYSKMGVWERNARKLGMRMRALGSGLIQTIFGPQGIIMIIGSAVTALLQNLQKVNAQAHEFAESMKRTAGNDTKEINSLLDSYTFNGAVRRKLSPVIHWTAEGQSYRRSELKFDEKALQGQNLSTAIEELKEKLQAYSPLYDGDLFDIYKFDDQVKQFEAIYKKLDNYQKAKRIEEITASQMEGIIKQTAGSWWGSRATHDTIIENMGDYANKMKSVMSDVDTLTEKDRFDISKALGLDKPLNTDQLRQLADELHQVAAAGGDTSAVLRKINKDIKNPGFIGLKLGINYGSNGFGTSKLGDYENVIREDLRSGVTAHMRSVMEQYLVKGENEAAMDYVRDVIKQLIVQAQVTDPMAISNIERIVLSELDEAMKGSPFNIGFSQIQAKVKFENEVHKNVTEGLKEGADDKEIRQALINFFTSMGPDLSTTASRLGYTTADSFVKAYMDRVKNELNTDAEWKKRFMNLNGQYGDVYAGFSKYSTNYVKSGDYYTAINMMMKDRKELIDQLKIMEEPLKSVWNIDVSTAFNFDKKSFEALKKVRDQIKAQLESEVITKDEKERLKPIYGMLDKEIFVTDALIKEGFDPFKDGKSKTRGGHGMPKDTQADIWRERIRLIIEARKAYDDWMKRLHNSTMAEKKVKDEFGKLAGVDKILKPGDLDDLDHYENALKKVEQEIEARYKTDKGDPKRSTYTKTDEALLIQIRKELEAIDKLKFDDKAEKFASSIKRLLDDLSYRWDIFQSVRQATGDVNFAQKASGLSEKDVEGLFQVESVKNLLESKIKPGISVEYGSLDSKSEEELKEYASKLVIDPNEPEKNLEQIEGIVDLLKEWVKLQRQLNKDAITGLSKTLAEGMTFNEQMAKIEADAKAEKDKIERLRGAKDENGKLLYSDDEINKALGIIDKRTDRQKWEKSQDYYNLMNLTAGLTATNFKALLERERKSIEADTTLSPQERSRRLQDLHKRERQAGLDNIFTEQGSYVGGLLAGGVNGALSVLDDKIQAEGENASEGDKQRRTSLEAWQKGLTGANAALGWATQTLDALAAAAESLSEMFDALGKENAAAFWSDTADAIRGISGIFAPAQSLVQSALSGDIGGLAASAIMSPVQMITGPITAFARLHDKRRERQIEKLRKDVQKVGDTIDMIKSLRERELGYNSGALRNNMLSYYNNTFRESDVKKLFGGRPTLSAAIEGMREYYSRGGTTGTGYSQEYEALKQQREDYLKMYDLEDDKKKTNQETIEEYKQKIAELDEQIMYFAEDLANSLWGIDLKGWAEQIGDALMTAFENGTSAADAFKDTVQDILRSMVKNMLVLGVIEPQLEKLRQKLFGENGTFDINNVEGTMGASLAAVTDFFSNDMPKIVAASKAFYDGADDIIKQNGGIGLGETERSTSVANSLSSTASEETMGVVAGYLARLSQDVSVLRIIQTQFVNESWGSYIDVCTKSNTSLSAIDSSTRAIMTMMRDGSGEMYSRIANISRRLDNFATGTDRMYIR